MNDSHNYGKIFKEWRVYLGYTQVEWMKLIQKEIGNDTPGLSSIKSWEVGRSVPSIRFIRAAAKVSGVSYQRFLEGPEGEGYGFDVIDHHETLNPEDFCLYKTNSNEMKIGVTANVEPHKIIGYVKIEINLISNQLP